MGTLDDTRRQISRELRYQSSVDLEAITYDAIRHLPMAKELSKLCRQTLTARLDTYALSHSEIFKATIQIIDRRILPILKRSGLAGEADFITRDSFFMTTPLAVDILTDVLSDRGYHVTYAPHVVQLPVKVDLQTGDIIHKKQITHFFKIKFTVSSIREWGHVQTWVADGTGGYMGSVDIASSYLPKGIDHQEKYRGKASRETLVAQSLALDANDQQEGLLDIQSPSDEDTTEMSHVEEHDFIKEQDVFISRLKMENELKTRK